MTFEEKLKIIADAIFEAKKATRSGQPTSLYFDQTNRLDKFNSGEIRNILYKLQDDGLITVQQKTNRLLPLYQQPINPKFRFIDVNTSFDDWYIKKFGGVISGETNLKTDIKAKYNSVTGALEVGNKKVVFKPDSFRARLLKLLFKNTKKKWFWDQIIKEIERVETSEKKFKDKVYDTVSSVNERIASETGITKFLIVSDKTYINPVFLE